MPQESLLLDALNERELEIIPLLAEGLSNGEIANQLFLAPSTVKWYVRQLNSKLDTTNRDEIVERADQLGLWNATKQAESYLRPHENLPRQTTLFVGRDAELDELHALIEKEDVRLLTILAPGGMGKTRIALETAEQQINNFPDGVYFVTLQALGSFDDQLITVLRQFITMLREGYSVLQCFEYVAENAPEPTAGASRQLVAEVMAGMRLPAAIEVMKKRVESKYFGRVVATMNQQFQEGGNLADKFDLLEEEFRKELGDLRWSNKSEYAEQLIIPTIAENCFFQFQADNRSTKQQALDFMANKKMLLLIDNWEHLLDGAPLLNEILNAAPEVKILATSREKLNLIGETVYVLKGMEFPTWETPQDALRYDAVQLLVQAAQRVKPDWQISESNLDYVARVCRLTEGMPLGILLAMSWLDMLSVQEIAVEIEKNVDFLETEMRDVPERQQSIRAIFNAAWDRLSEKEQDIFTKMSVFHGGFTREAAEKVTGANLRILQSLMNKALIQVNKGGRYDLHELLRQYGEESLRRAGLDEAIQMAHTRYFMKYCEEHLTYVETKRQAEVLQIILQDYDNIETAWLYAIEKRLIELLPSITKMSWIYEITCSNEKGLRLYERTLEIVPDEYPVLRGMLLSYMSTRTMRLSRFDLTIEYATRAMALLPEADAHYARLLAEGTIPISYAAWGDFERAQRIYETVRSKAQKYDFKILEFIAVSNLSLIEANKGNYERAIELASSVVDQEMTDWSRGMIRRNLSRYHCVMQEYEEAWHFAQEALLSARKINYQQIIYASYDMLAYLAFIQQDDAGVGHYLQQLRQSAITLNVPFLEPHPLEIQMWLHNGERQRVRETLQNLVTPTTDYPFDHAVLLVAATYLAATSHLTVTMLSFVKRRTVLWGLHLSSWEIADAIRQLEQFEPAFSTDEYLAAYERGKTIELETILQELQTELNHEN